MQQVALHQARNAIFGSSIALDEMVCLNDNFEA